MFKHVTVLLKETIDAVALNPDGLYVDMTLGGGGHTEELAQRLSDKAAIIGIDRDLDALSAAQKRLGDTKCKIHYVHRNYQELDSVVHELGYDLVDGIICDLGVSSYQLDTAERGFSYQQDARLDMRMDQTQAVSAQDVVNLYSQMDLEQIIKNYGEERWAKRIAFNIIEARRKRPIEMTEELVEIIKKSMPTVAKKNGPHPAKRTFQAIRIEVNKELDGLEDTIQRAISILKSGGRIAMISFHSLEDRIVKRTFKELARECICPPELPICTCQHRAVVSLVGKAIRPTEFEVANNPRARSATLRVAKKI